MSMIGWSHNLYSINYVWALVAGFLVMFMQAGFMLVETGLCRAKNASHTSAMNLMIYPLGCLAFWVYGFAIGWGNWWNGPVPPGWYPSLGPGLSVLNEGWGLGAAVDAAGKATGAFTYGLIGMKGWFLTGAVGDTGVMVLFFFMMVFMDTTATIPTGAMAERWAWKNFCPVRFVGCAALLPLCAIGFGAVVGWRRVVLIGASAMAQSISPVPASFTRWAASSRSRARWSSGRASANSMRKVDRRPCRVTTCRWSSLGTFILAFGWFGFNPGSTLAGTDLRISFVVVNTMLAGISRSACRDGHAHAEGPQARSDDDVQRHARRPRRDHSALRIRRSLGGGGHRLGCRLARGRRAVFFWERRGIDDPVGAISVHGVNGLWGVISVGIFATGQYGAGWNGVVREEMVKLYGSDGVRGLLYGDFSQFFMQLIDAGTVAIFGFVMAYVWFKISDLITPIRVSKEVEIEGLDGPEMGVLGYPDFQLHPSGMGITMVGESAVASKTAERQGAKVVVEQN